MRGEVLVTGDCHNRVPGPRRFAGPSSLLLCVAHAPHHGRTRGCGGRLPGPPLGSLPGLGRLVLEGLGPRRLPMVPDQTPRQLRPVKTVRNPDFAAVSPFARHAAGSPVPCVVRWPAAARWTCSSVSTAQLMTFTAVVKSSTPAPSPPRATAVPRPSPAVCLFGRPPFHAGSLSGILSGPPSSLSEMPFLASGRCSFRYPRAIFGALRSGNYRVPVMVRDPCFARELMIC